MLVLVSRETWVPCWHKSYAIGRLDAQPTIGGRFASTIVPNAFARLLLMVACSLENARSERGDACDAAPTYE